MWVGVIVWRWELGWEGATLTKDDNFFSFEIFNSVFWNPNFFHFPESLRQALIPAIPPPHRLTPSPSPMPARTQIPLSRSL